MFQSYTSLLLACLLAGFAGVVLAVAATGAREQNRRRSARRPGEPIRVESNRALYYAWLARHDGPRRRH